MDPNRSAAVRHPPGQQSLLVTGRLPGPSTMVLAFQASKVIEHARRHELEQVLVRVLSITQQDAGADRGDVFKAALLATLHPFRDFGTGHGEDRVTGERRPSWIVDHGRNSRAIE